MVSNLINQLYNEMENRILNGDYKQDEILTEQKIADEFHVSRTPVREVFQLLLANGLIDTNDKKEVRVQTFSQKDMLDIYDLRIQMEGRSAKLCAENCTDEVIDKLQETILLQELYLSKGNVKHVWELDEQFHSIIHGACMNRLLKKMLDDFLHYTKFVRRHSYDSAGRCEKSVLEHKEIFTAIKDRDAAKAQVCMTQHVQNARENLIANGFFE